MRVSGLRLRLAGGFAAAFAIGLALLAAFGIAYLWRESTRRLDVRLNAVALGVLQGLARERHETQVVDLLTIAREVAREWPGHAEAFIIMDAAKKRVVAVGPDSLANRVVQSLQQQAGARHASDTDVDPDLRIVVLDTVIAIDSLASNVILPRMPVRIVAYGSTEGIKADAEVLAVLFGVSAPLILLISLGAGYMLAGRALRPVQELANAMAAIAPTDLNRRLNAGTGRDDEVSAVATEFNALLARLEEAQKRNGNFVREAAHQIRTPLTLVLGEAGHALNANKLQANDESSRMYATLGRIRTAAEVMRRRVDELFLLAEARTGEAVRLEQQVELDGLVLECTDLMRARATESGHKLAIGNADAVVVQGHAALLQEALLELLENACRYGATTTPITVSCCVEGVQPTARAVLEVSSGGAPFSLPPVAVSEHATHGMGLSIVRWVAESHHAELSVKNDNGINRVSLSFPLSA